MKSKEEIQSELNLIFQSVFKNENIALNDTTTADDINGWDSLTHMHLIDSVERHFNCEFNFSEVMNFRNVGDMVNAISNKLS